MALFYEGIEECYEPARALLELDENVGRVLSVKMGAFTGRCNLGFVDYDVPDETGHLKLAGYMFFDPVGDEVVYVDVAVSKQIFHHLAREYVV